MFSYHHAKAVEEERFGRHRQGDDAVVRRARHVRLGHLLTALAGRLAALGMREGRGKVRPAGPAY